MYCFFTNDNEKKGPDGRLTHGTILREGRFSWRLSEAVSLRWTWCFFDRRLSTAIGLAVNGTDQKVTFHVALRWLFSLYFSIEWPLLIRWLGLDYESAKRREQAKRASVVPARDVVPAYADCERRLELRFFDWGVWWTIWFRDDYTSSRDPKWRRGSWHYLDTLLGCEKYTKHVLKEQIVVVPLPEGRYRAHLEFDRCEWKRPRWPWPKTRHGAYIDFLKGGSTGGPPVPGKGENSWDCGPDAIQAMSLDATDVESAIGETVKRVLKNRVRYGGAHDYSETA